MNESILSQIRELKENYDYDFDKINIIADKIEEAIGSAECWNTLRLGFSTIEFLENLEYIAKENDL